jgi:zinc protease
MRAIATFLAVLACAGAAQAQEAATPKRRWRDIQMPPLRQFTAPKPERTVLPNGTVVLLMEDHELPTIDAVVLMRAGSYLEPREKAGLGSICGDVMRSGGSESKKGDDLDATLEDMASSVEVSVGPTETRASLSCLKESFEKTLPLLLDVLEHPAFPQDKLDLAKKQAKSAIARRNDDPSGIARREAARIMYGDDSPYGWTTEVATVDAIKRDDLVEFHKTWLLDPKATIVGVVGDFDPKDMKSKIEATFGKWKKDGKPAPGFPEVQGDGPPPKVHFAKKTDVNQATIVMGHLGMKRDPKDADYAATVVANDILGGGGFAARLLQRVRTKMGLAYGVGSNFNAPYSHKGWFSLTCQTKSGSTVKAIEAMRNELRLLVEEPVTADELRVAKQSIQQQLIFDSETRADVLTRALRYEYYGFPADYLEQFQAAIAKVTAQDVARVAKGRFHPEKMVTLVVGNDAEFDKPLSTLGEVVALDYETPAYPKGGAKAGTEKKAASAADIAKGKALIAKAIELKGGRKALEAVKSLRMKASGVASMQGQAMPMEITSTKVYPDKVRDDLVVAGGMARITRVLTGDKGWAKGPPGVMDLPPSEAKEMRDDVMRDDIPLLLALSKEDAKPVALGKEEFEEGEDVVELEAVDVGEGTKLYFDDAGVLVRRRETSAKGEALSVWSDFREVSGLKMPFSVRVVLGDQTVKLAASTIEVNPEIAPDTWDRPAGNDAQPGRPARRGAGTGDAPRPPAEKKPADDKPAGDKKPEGEKSGAGAGAGR